MAASALTYTSLVSDIQTYVERTDEPFVSQIPRFIMLAENRLASELHGLGFLRAVSFNLVSGTQTYAKPARWRETKSLSVTVSGVKQYLKPRGYEYCREFTGSGAPVYYADYDYEHVFLAQVPNSALPCEWLYYERPEPLSSTNETNWTTQYAPQLLLYASLLEAQPFLKLPERVNEFMGLYERAAKVIMGEDADRLTDATVVRSKK